MTVNCIQEGFVEIGKTLNWFARHAGRDLFYSFSKKIIEGNPVTNSVKKICTVFRGVIFGCVAVVLTPLSLSSYTLASLSGTGRIKVTEPKNYSEAEKKLLKVFVLNICAQDPHSIRTGNLVTPLEKLTPQMTRLEALLALIWEKDCDVVLLTEVEDLDTQTKIAKAFKEKGFFSAVDTGATAPIRNNSGHFIASKWPLKDLRFTTFKNDERKNLYLVE